MKRFLLPVLAVMLAASLSGEAMAGGRRANRIAYLHSSQSSWNGDYYNVQQGGPVALVVPPTASSMAAWSWGVAQSEVRPLYHQYGRAYVGGAAGGSSNPYKPTPYWPSHTDEFGIYPVRGPWR
jgi:hypothetical protein